MDTSALRVSRDYRLLVIGGLISGIGTQVTLVALPYQVFVLTGSSFLVGLIGLVELVPLVVPLTLLRHHVRLHQVAYLAGQVYLQPHPKELMLRNHAS